MLHSSYWHFSSIFCKSCSSGFENGPCKVGLFCQVTLFIFPLQSSMLSRKLGTHSQNRKLATGPLWQLKVGTCVFLKKSLDLAIINHRWAITMGQCTAKLKVCLMDWKSSAEASIQDFTCWNQGPWLCVLTDIYIHICMDSSLDEASHSSFHSDGLIQGFLVAPQQN